MTDAENLNQLLMTLAHYGYRASSITLASGVTLHLFPAAEELSPLEKRAQMPDDSPRARAARDIGLTNFNG